MANQLAELLPAVSIFPAELGETILQLTPRDLGPDICIVIFVVSDVLRFVTSGMIIAKSHSAMHIVLRSNPVRVGNHTVKPNSGTFANGENIASRNAVPIHEFSI